MDNNTLTKALGLSFGKKAHVWTQDFVPVNYIKDGVLIVQGKTKERYVKVLQIMPINFAIKTPEEQDMIVIKYARWLKTAPNSFQIKVVTEKTDIDDYLKVINAAYYNEKSEKCKLAIKNYITYLYEKGVGETTKKKYYLIFEYESQRFQAAAKTEDEAIAALNARALQIKSELADIGNDVICYTFTEKEDENCDYILGEILYKHYNRRTSITESFDDRVSRIEKDTMTLTGTAIADDIEINDIKTILAPKSIDTEDSPDYMIVDGMYRGFYYVKSNSYPSVMQTTGGWLANILSFGYGYDIDVFFSKSDPNQKLIAIRNHSKWASYGLNNSEAEQLDYETKINNYQGTMYMKKAIQEWKEDVYEMSVLITIHAMTKEEFYFRRSIMMETAIKLGLEFGECRRFQEEGFFSSGFHNALSPKIYNLSHRNITTSGVAAAYAFTAFSLTDKEGVALGIHRQNKSLIVYDPFNTQRYANANIAIYGASGHGKTFTLLNLITRLRCLGVQNFVLTPDKQHEFLRVVDAVDGTFIDLSNSSKDRINIFDIVPMSSPSEEFLGAGLYNEKEWLTSKIEELLIWVKYVQSDMPQSVEVSIGNILYEMYNSFGITKDNNSIYKNGTSGELKEMPTMQDFYDRLKSSPNIPEETATIFSAFVNGEASNMNGHTNVNLDNKFVVFGLENVSKKYIASTLFLVLQYVWGRCKQDRTKKKMISIDEGWQLLNGQDQQVGEFVEHIFKVIRGFGGGAIFATQSIADLFKNKNNYGNAILSCSHSKIILGMETKDLQMIQAELGITGNEAAGILNAKVGDALLCAGTNHIEISVDASEYEKELFTTDRAEMARLVSSKKYG